jgi:branched-chain amino acid transport system substrate-binding protein
MTISRTRVSRRVVLGGAAGLLAAPRLGRAEGKTIRIGMPTILSGRIALLGTSARNAVMMEVEKINAEGGLAGRPVEMLIRDSKGNPQEAARVARELVNTDGCEMLLDCEASTGAFAINQVAKDLGVLCVHCDSETSALTADPKLRVSHTFRSARQGIHDSVVGGIYAAKIAEAQKLTRWASCAPDYAYGRDTTAQFFGYLKHFKPDIELISESWPKLGQPDYTDTITRIAQAKPQALYSCLYGGDITSFIDQGNIYALFGQMQFFAVNMADYPVLTAVKNLPEGIHSGNRYLTTFPATPQNAEWGEAYHKRYNEYPTNWSWESATGMRFIAEAAKRAGSTDTAKVAAALTGLTIDSPFGTNGKITMRAEDHTIIDYAIGWGITIPKPPYVIDMQPGDWGQIFELETEWKRQQGYV